MKYITTKRIWVDDHTYDKLSEMVKITRGYINREMLCNAIIYEWIDSGGITKVNNIRYVEVDTDGRVIVEYMSKRHCLYLVVEEELWDNFKTLCSTNGLNIDIGFKIALNNFIDLAVKDSIDILNYFLGNGRQ